MDDVVKLSESQVENIVAMVIERTLNKMVPVMGNLMQQQATANKIKKDFYTKYPEFLQHKDVVVDVVSKIEGKNLTTDLDVIMMQAVPEIRRKIQIKESLNTTNVKTFDEINKTVLPETDIKINDISGTENDNGVI